MSAEFLFQIQGVLGYVAWLLCFGVYVWPRLKSMEQVDAQRRRILFAATSPAQGSSSLR